MNVKRCFLCGHTFGDNVHHMKLFCISKELDTWACPEHYGLFMGAINVLRRNLSHEPKTFHHTEMINDTWVRFYNAEDGVIINFRQDRLPFWSKAPDMASAQEKARQLLVFFKRNPLLAALPKPRPAQTQR